jgi:hypothetical protein
MFIYLGMKDLKSPQEYGTGGEILFGSNSIITEKMQCWADWLVHVCCCQQTV